MIINLHKTKESNECDIVINESVDTLKIEDSNKVLIIVDENIPNIYIDELHVNLKNNIIYTYTVKSGESSKSFDNYQSIIKVLIENDFSRKDVIIGFGGGVVLDLSGFVASTYKRSIPFISIPTTTLAIVDASIGGKNALNVQNVKNMVGTFYMPKKVIINTKYLKSLDDRNYASGIMESLKMALIDDKYLYGMIKNNDLNYFRLNDKALEELIVRSINIKKKIVKIDPYENNIRKVLNLGHTLGHAVEAILNEKKIEDVILHGEAIALGLLAFCNDLIFDDIKRIIDKYLKLDYNFIKTINLENILEKIKNDKKTNQELIDIVYLENYNNVIIKKMHIKEVEKRIFKVFNRL